MTLLCGIDENDPDFDENVPLPLAATCKGRASFPTAVVTDARCLGGGLGGSTRDLWNTLSLENMNTWLSESLTKQEVKANLSSSPNLENLPTFRLRFTPSPVGSEKCEIVLQFFNPGFLATKFEIHFPNEREVAVPQWADEVSWLSLLFLLLALFFAFPIPSTQIKFIRTFTVCLKRELSSLHVKSSHVRRCSFMSHFLYYCLILGRAERSAADGKPHH